METLKAYVVCL